MTPKKVLNFLDKKGITYKIEEHKIVYTSYDKSRTSGIDLKLIGKSLIIKADNEFVIVLIPGNKNLDKEKFKKTINAIRKKEGGKASKKVDFATERWIKNNLKGVKLGAIPPFGELFKLPVFVDKSILKNKKIYISGGSYNNSIVISPANFKKIGEIKEGVFLKAKK